MNSGSFVTTGGAEITLIVDGFTERWSFNAKGAPAKGQFNVVFRVLGGQIHVRGDVICYNINGKHARVAGVVRWSSDPAFYGQQAFWSVEDNGEGSSAVPDRATPYSPAYGAAATYCAVPPTFDPTTFPVESGNVQIHQ